MHPRNLTCTYLELLLLQEHHLGTVRHGNVEPLHVLGLADQLHDLLVKVDKDPAGLRVLHEQRGGQAGLALLDGPDPGLVPQGLELDQRLCDLVVGLDDLLGLLGGHEVLVLGEPLHGGLDAPQQLTGPHDVA